MLSQDNMFFQMPLSQYLFSYKLARLRSAEQPRRAHNRDFQDVTNIRRQYDSDLANAGRIANEFSSRDGDGSAAVLHLMKHRKLAAAHTKKVDNFCYLQENR